MTHVRLDLEALITHPRRPRKSPRARRVELVPVTRQQLQALLQMRSQLPDRRRPATRQPTEHHGRTDMHQRAVIRLLKLQERRIKRSQVILSRDITTPPKALTGAA